MSAAKAIPTVSILVLVMVIGAVIGSPSLVSIIAFLAAVFCVGARLVGLFVHDPLLQVTAGLQVGLGVVVLTILVPFGTMTNLPLDLNLLLIATIAVSTLLIDAGYVAKGEPWKNDLIHYTKMLRNVPIRSHLPILAILCATVVLHLVYQMGNTSTILPDGALNFVAARSLATSGSFSANVLSNAPVVSPFSPTVGLNVESGTWFILSAFFSLGGVSFGVDLIMLLVLGLLLLLPIYTIGRLWFGSRAWVPALVASCLPVLLFFSSVPYGAEITSTVFAISGICILESFRLKEGRIPAAGFAFAGILFSVSGISWEPIVTLVYIVGYGIVLMFQGDESKTGRLLFLPISALFGISVLYSETWSLNPWFFTLFAFLLPVVGWVWKHRQPGLELVLACTSFAFSLFLSRYYLLPQYIIKPSLAYSARTTASTVLSYSFSFSSLNSHTLTYLHNLELGGTYPLILLSVASVFFINWVDVKHVLFAYVFLILDAIAVIIVLDPSTGFSANFSATRFLIGSYLMLVMLSSATIIRIADQVIPRVKLALSSSQGFVIGLHLTKRLNPRLKLNRNQIAVVLVATLLCIGSAPVIYAYASEYRTSVNAVHTEDYPQFLGVLSSENWIQQSVPPGTVFQVASGDSAQVWAMEIADMRFAALNVVRNGTIIPLSEVEIGDVLSSASAVNATYIIFDSDVNSFGMTSLQPYYDFSSSSVGQEFPVFPDTSNLSRVVQSDAITSLRLVYAGGQVPDRVLIYKIESAKPALLWASDFGISGNWQVQLNGTISSNSTQLRLSTPPFESDKVYAVHVFNQKLMLQNDTYLVYRTSSQDAGTSAGVYIRLKNGKDAIYTSGVPGTHFVDLGTSAGSSPDFIYVYNILGSQLASTSSSYQVTYSWVALVTLLPT